MKNTVKKALSLILIMSLSVTFLFSCSGKVGAFSENKKTVMEIEGHKISYDEYRYFYYNCMLDMGDGSDFTKPETLELLKTRTENALRRKYAVISYCDKYEIELSKNDKKEINQFVSEYIESLGGKDKYENALLLRRMTGDVFRSHYEFLYYDLYLRELLFTGYENVIKVDDQTVKSDVLANFYRYTQIFIPFDSGDSYSDNLELANEAYQKLVGGADFAEVAKEYSEWTGDVNKGVYTTKGEKLLQIEETALALGEGEYSQVIFTSEGHHIIKRLPLEEAFIDDNLAEYPDCLVLESDRSLALRYISATRRYNELIEKTATELNVSYKKYYGKLSHGQLVTK